MKNKISEAIHYNRDENSFTVRFFERLILGFEKNNEHFQEFLNKIQESAEKNKENLENDSLQSPSFSKSELEYVDSMPFLENIDLYSYCINKIGCKKKKIDKTEFDYVIVAKDKSEKEILIVFEVKCFTDLRHEEIMRQNKWLEYYKSFCLFHDYYHIALISYENIERGTVPKREFKTENFSIISWDDIEEFIDYKRIKKEIEFDKLKKTIHMDGTSETDRFLIKK